MLRLCITLCISLLASVFSAHATFNPLEIIPADKSQVSSLSSITVQWPGEWLGSVASGTCGKVTDEAGSVVATLTCEEDWGYLNAACNLILSEKITTPGKYSVYVDANTVFDEDEEYGNEAFTLQYEIVEGSQEIKLLSANPENNSIVASLNTIKTYWSARISVVHTEVTGEVLDDENEKICDVTISRVFSSDPVTLTLSETIVSPGKYKVIIPAGALESEDGSKSEECTLSYTVSESAATTLSPAEINPANDSVIACLAKITIVWNSEFDFGYEAEEVGKVTDESGNTIATLDCVADWMDENTLVFNLSQPVTEDGTYSVFIEAGKIVAADGSRNDDIELTYTIDSSKVEANLKFWVFPSASRIEDEFFPDIEIEFDEKVELNVTEFTFESDQHDIVKVNADLWYDTVTLDCSAINKAGVWTLTIPEGAFKSIETGNINPEKTYQWEFVSTLTGIGNVMDKDRELRISSEKITIRGYDEVWIFDLVGKLYGHYQGNSVITLQPGIYFIRCMAGNQPAIYKVVIE